MEICEIFKLYLKQEIVKLKIVEIQIAEFEQMKSDLFQRESLNTAELIEAKSDMIALHDFDFQKNIFSENQKRYTTNPLLKLEYYQANKK